MRRKFIASRPARNTLGSFPRAVCPRHKGSDQPLLQEIMHKHQGELRHRVHRWGTLRMRSLQTCLYITLHVQKWWKNLRPQGGGFSL